MAYGGIRQVQTASKPPPYKTANTNMAGVVRTHKTSQFRKPAYHCKPSAVDPASTFIPYVVNSRAYTSTFHQRSSAN